MRQTNKLLNITLLKNLISLQIKTPYTTNHKTILSQHQSISSMSLFFKASSFLESGSVFARRLLSTFILDILFRPAMSFSFSAHKFSNFDLELASFFHLLFQQPLFFLCALMTLHRGDEPQLGPLHLHLQDSPHQNLKNIRHLHSTLFL